MAIQRQLAASPNEKLVSSYKPRRVRKTKRTSNGRTNQAPDRQTGSLAANEYQSSAPSQCCLLLLECLQNSFSLEAGSSVEVRQPMPCRRDKDRTTLMQEENRVKHQRWDWQIKIHTDRNMRGEKQGWGITHGDVRSNMAAHWDCSGERSNAPSHGACWTGRKPNRILLEQQSTLGIEHESDISRVLSANTQLSQSVQPRRNSWCWKAKVAPAEYYKASMEHCGEQSLLITKDNSWAGPDSCHPLPLMHCLSFPSWSNGARRHEWSLEICSARHREH